VKHTIKQGEANDNQAAASRQASLPNNIYQISNISIWNAHFYWSCKL